MKKLIWSILFIFSTAIVFTQSNIRLSIDTNYVEIGDQANLIQEVSLANNATFVSAPLTVFDSIYKSGMEEKEFGLFEIIESSDWIIQGNKRMRKITFTAWEEGRYAIPPSLLNYTVNGQRGQSNSNSINIIVHSPLDPNEAVNDSLRLAPIKPIIATKMDLWRDLIRPALIGLGILLALLGLIYFIYRLFSKETPVRREPYYIKPQHIAYRRLKELQDKKPWEQGDIKGFHSDLTFAIREYLENRFNINAVEMSTGEIMRAIRKGNVSDNWVDQLQSLFNTADMVKFAKAVPPFDIHMQTLEKCKTFVEDTQTDSILIELKKEEEALYDRSVLLRKPKQEEQT